MTRRNPPVVMIILVLALAACGGRGGPAPSDRHYRLPAPQTEATASPVMPALVLNWVKPLDALAKPAIAYTDAVGLELEHYRYHRWASPPAALVEDYLLNALRQSGIAGQIVADPLPSDEAMYLNVTVSRFERIHVGERRQAAVSLVVELRPTQVAAPISVERMNVEVDATGPDMVDTVEAFGVAMDELSDQIVRWIEREVPR